MTEVNGTGITGVVSVSNVNGIAIASQLLELMNDNTVADGGIEILSTGGTNGNSFTIECNRFLLSVMLGWNVYMD